MQGWAFLMAAIVLEVIGTSGLRDTQGFSRILPSIVVLGAYAASIYLMGLAAEELPVGIVYTVWCGVGIILVFGIAAARVGEMPDTAAMVGALLVMLGIGVMSFGTSMQVE